ncbi:hypothetical protein FHW84_000043 [Dyella sp. SG562]|nr:hypothetical protein [Dyella sp. SG562]NII71487.1 hypothetical protein [Dyella sp. SG562]
MRDWRSLLEQDMNKMRHPVGIPWFIKEDYEAFRRLVPQRSWHTTFGQWEAAATKVLDQQRRAGVLAFKVEVQSESFALWCLDTGHSVDREALSEYASKFARRLLASNDSG